MRASVCRLPTRARGRPSPGRSRVHTGHGGATAPESQRFRSDAAEGGAPAPDRPRRAPLDHTHYGDGSFPAFAGVIGWQEVNDPVDRARFVNAVVLRNKQTGKKLAFVSTHLISGAWNGKHPNRQGRWLRHLDVLESEITRLRRLHKAPVVVGDFNRRRAENLSGLRILDVKDVAGYTIDEIYVPDNAVATKSHQVQTFGSDHHAYKARVDW
ncbi:hypothetical protein N798_02860 [Knoellia flava TL1]|uniref:Endonuclease/exonuclease/phosphatase domain-containing protein n=2 Tax=Knoellia flava TaxID=913969 RepID=A0A8H9KRE2_9MICO|nr:hypothetical protein [Knoellia flava]KGN35424.1 hypothetical protein N798_02860 [Knoellia flava TL1]GGB69096.1 hypothetical protein GCM10011314_05460 [Knoellia flava]